MKRTLSVMVILCCLACPGVGYALTKCVQLGTGTSCDQPDLGSLQYSVDWGTSCHNSNNGNGRISISGIGACSSSSGSFGTRLSRISTGYTASDTDPTSTDDNKYCWCRILEPAVSYWMYVANFSTASRCHSDCAVACGESIGGTSTIGLYGDFY